MLIQYVTKIAGFTGRRRVQAIVTSQIHALRARIVDRRLTLHPRSRRDLPRSRYVELSTQVDEILGDHGEIAGSS